MQAQVNEYMYDVLKKAGVDSTIQENICMQMFDMTAMVDY